MTREDFLKLIDAYGDACFDCGEWQKDNTDTPYETVLAHQQAAREAVIQALLTMQPKTEAQ
jgi:hypothetical protein